MNGTRAWPAAAAPPPACGRRRSPGAAGRCRGRAGRGVRADRRWLDKCTIRAPPLLAASTTARVPARLTASAGSSRARVTPAAWTTTSASRPPPTPAVSGASHRSTPAGSAFRLPGRRSRERSPVSQGRLGNVVSQKPGGAGQANQPAFIEPIRFMPSPAGHLDAGVDGTLSSRSMTVRR